MKSKNKVKSGFMLNVYKRLYWRSVENGDLQKANWYGNKYCELGGRKEDIQRITERM